MAVKPAGYVGEKPYATFVSGWVPYASGITGGTALSNGVHPGALDRVPALARDGSIETEWHSDDGPERWIGIDFGAPTTIAGFTLRQRSAAQAGPSNGHFFKTVTVDHSDDGVTWIPGATTTVPAEKVAASALVSLEIGSVHTARFWRARQTGPNALGMNWFVVSEMAFFNDHGAGGFQRPAWRYDPDLGYIEYRGLCQPAEDMAAGSKKTIVCFMDPGPALPKIMFGMMHWGISGLGLIATWGDVFRIDSGRDDTPGAHHYLAFETTGAPSIPNQMWFSLARVHRSCANDPTWGPWINVGTEAIAGSLVKMEYAPGFQAYPGWVGPRWRCSQDFRRWQVTGLVQPTRALAGTVDTLFHVTHPQPHDGAQFLLESMGMFQWAGGHVGSQRVDVIKTAIGHDISFVIPKAVSPGYVAIDLEYELPPPRRLVHTWDFNTGLDGWVKGSGGIMGGTYPDIVWHPNGHAQVDTPEASFMGGPGIIHLPGDALAAAMGGTYAGGDYELRVTWRSDLFAGAADGNASMTMMLGNATTIAVGDFAAQPVFITSVGAFSIIGSGSGIDLGWMVPGGLFGSPTARYRIYVDSVELWKV
jgi:hypothetical protein